MTDWRAILTNAGFRPRPGAAPEAVAHTETVLGVTFPPDLRDLYAASNGAGSNEIDIITLAAAEKYGEFGAEFGYAPFTDANDSDFYAVCCIGPLAGFVAHVHHDDDARLICRGLARFFELVAEARRMDPDDADAQGYGPPERLLGDFAFDRPERAAEGREVARRLLELGRETGPGEYNVYCPLRFAAQLFGPGDEAELEGVLALGGDSSRETVLRRWRGLGTAEARRLLATHGPPATQPPACAAKNSRAFASS